MCAGEGGRGGMGLSAGTHERMGGRIRHDSETIAALEMQIKQMETESTYF